MCVTVVDYDQCWRDRCGWMMITAVRLSIDGMPNPVRLRRTRITNAVHKTVDDDI